MSDSPTELSADTLVAERYRVHERIGAGGMGVVYRATDTRLKRQVALKRVLLRDVDDDEAAEIRHRTLREAEIAARVHHPRIVSIFDVLDERGGPLLVLEYLPSRSLGELVADVGVLTPGVAARAGAQIAEALAVAHAAGIVHRDVKPGNVLVGPGDPLGPTKLADFGISHLPDSGTLTSHGIGTPAYFAPEIARGDRPGPASDVYALGATLCTAVQGEPPFGRGDGNPLELIRRIAQGPVPKPRTGGPLGDLLTRLTAADPADCPTAAEAAAELWQLADRPEPLHPAPGDTGPSSLPGLANTHPSDPTSDPPAPTSRPWYRRRTVLAGAGVVLAAAIAGGVLVSTDGGDDGGGAGAAPRFPTSIPLLRIGDERTADPCAPVRPEALQSFGTPTLVPDYGNFAACEIELTQRGSDTMDVTSRYRPQSSTPPEGDQQRLGDGLIVRRPASDGLCRRYVVLADGTQLEITAEFSAGSDSRGPLSDVCAVAEAATASAATTLTENGVGRREPPTTGLWTADACTLLTPEDLSFIQPPANRSDGYRNVGGWQCEWGDEDENGSGVMISFDRYSPPQATGDQVPGTPVYIKRDDGDDVCNVEVPKRPFISTGGQAQEEVLRIKTDGPLSKQQLCERATALAVAANSRT